MPAGDAGRLGESGIAIKVNRIGLKDVYSSMVGDQGYLRHYYGIDSNTIVEYIKKEKANFKEEIK